MNRKCVLIYFDTCHPQLKKFKLMSKIFGKKLKMFLLSSSNAVGVVVDVVITVVVGNGVFVVDVGNVVLSAVVVDCISFEDFVTVFMEWCVEDLEIGFVASIFPSFFVLNRCCILLVFCTFGAFFFIFVTNDILLISFSFCDPVECSYTRSGTLLVVCNPSDVDSTILPNLENIGRVATLFRVFTGLWVDVLGNVIELETVLNSFLT